MPVVVGTLVKSSVAASIVGVPVGMDVDISKVLKVVLSTVTSVGSSVPDVLNIETPVLVVLNVAAIVIQSGFIGSSVFKGAVFDVALSAVFNVGLVD